MLPFLGSIYGVIANLRNLLYDRGVFDSFDLAAKTISIGNITVGGTGKTPLVAYVSATLAERGERVCVLTRGYGRKNPRERVLVSDGEKILADPSEAGDEPFELARKLLGKAVVIADADRVSAAEWAKRRFGVTAFVLDDGFQHRKLKRGVDIVCIDATDPFGGDKMLPAGRLREPVANLRRADIIVITRADLVKDISDLRSEILRLNPGASVFTARNQIIRIIELSGFFNRDAVVQNKAGVLVEHSAIEPKRDRAFAFSGIGNPDSFFNQIRDHGVNLVAANIYRDHHRYSQKDIEREEGVARKGKADFLITTVKDAVKLKDLVFTMPCFVVEIEMLMDEESVFAALL